MPVAEEQEPQVQGVPPGLTAEPLNQPEVSGVPPGLTAEPIAPSVEGVPKGLTATPITRDSLTAMEPLGTRPGVLGAATTIASDFGAGVLTPILHPVDTVKGMIQSSPPIAAATDISQAVRKLRTGQPTDAEQQGAEMLKHPVESAAMMAGQAVTGALAGEAAGAGWEAYRNAYANKVMPPKAPPPAAPAVAAVPEGVAPGGPSAPPAPPTPPAPVPTQVAPEPEGPITIHAGPKPERLPAPQIQPKPYAEAQPNLDDIVAHTQTVDALRDQVKGQSAADIRALQDAVDETGRQAFEAGDQTRATEAAKAHTALSQLLEEAVAETQARGAGKGGNLQDAQAALTGGDITPEGVKAPAKPVSPSAVAAVLNAIPQKPVKGDPSKPVLHASNDVEALRDSAERQAPKIGDAVKQATQAVPGAKLEAVRDSKDTGRIEDKAERQGVAPSQIGDIAAAKVIVPDQPAAEKVLHNLNGKLPVEKVEGSVDGEPGKNGVQQVQAIVDTQAPGEPVKKAEVLIQTPEMAKATDQTHDDYRRAQDLRAQGKDAEADKIESQIQQVHEEAQAPLKVGDAIEYQTNKGKTRSGKIERIEGDRAQVRDSFATVWKPLSSIARPSNQGAKGEVGSSRVDLQACKLEYSIVSPK